MRLKSKNGYKNKTKRTHGEGTRALEI